MKKYIILTITLSLIVALNIGSCSEHVLTNNLTSEDKDIIIFIPGFYGSTLNETGGKQEKVWLSVNNALFDNNTLVMPNLGFNNEKKYKVGSVFKELSVIPYLYTSDVYGDFLTDLKNNIGTNYQVVEFAYDWRKDVAESAALLNDYVLELKANGAHTISIISHSMGGHITNYFLRYGGQELKESKEDWSGYSMIDKVVIAAAPFGGTVSIFKDIFTGVQFGLNTSLLSPEAYSSFPSTYQLMGNHNLYYQGKLLDYFDTSLWIKNHWSLANNQFENFNQYKKVRLNRLNELLEMGKLYQEKIFSASTEDSSEQNKQLLKITGKGNESPGIGLWGENENTVLWKIEDIGKARYEKFYSDGDGLVTLQSAELPDSLKEKFEVSNIYSTYTHSKILNDPLVKERIYSFFK